MHATQTHSREPDRAPLGGARQVGPHRERRASAHPSILAPLPQLFEELRARPDGLSSDEARQKLADTGPNVLETKDEQGMLLPLVRQLTHPLALLLWLAAVLALTTQSVTLGVAIVAVIALNAGFALIQERHAQHAVAALSRYLPQHAAVVRDGAEQVVDASEVVPGDVLVVREGDAVCADGRVL